MKELRCNKLHAVLRNGLVEVRCTSRLCGAGSEIVVIHYFSLKTGQLVDTKEFSNPNRKREVLVS